ncbi:phage major tail protein, phi13 family [Alteribacillus persepolensis]|uniref:Phage major tail protein, phi13 family n=1 Tax=Alteribacillus persepolensis TaxID=568899 RepID=A0A1G8IKF3_9BACI|nr:major tail protein [Alteribacillus persepolensis]SDI19271.1 phage major tail protein, phi13 family [Alteribacillus persepolensis]
MGTNARVGLRDIHVALITEEADGTITYDTPKKIAGAIEATMTPNTSRATLYADDRPAENAQSLAETEVSFGVGYLELEDYALLLGKEVNADGAIVETIDDKPPYVAFGFRSERSDGTFEYNWYLKGDFAVPEESYNTKNDSIEFQTQTITGQFIAREDGKWRSRIVENDTADQTVIDGWFDAVYDEETEQV